MYQRSIKGNNLYFLKIEVIFGYAPFVSNSLEELEKKILDDTPIQVIITLKYFYFEYLS